MAISRDLGVPRRRRLGRAPGGHWARPSVLARAPGCYDDAPTMDTTLDPADPPRHEARPDDLTCLAVAWCRDAPERAGEILRIPARAGVRWVLGRGHGSEADVTRLLPVRMRPTGTEPARPFEDRSLSREQLVIEARDDTLEIENRGRCPLLLRGAEVTRCTVAQGDVLELRGRLVLVCVRRPRELPPLRDYPLDRAGSFGAPDADGIVGESPAAWRLRDQVAFVARRSAHVLVSGESGVGKELVARAVTAISSRALRPLVSRNAATVPAGLVDAELFGNTRSYPNPGMAERPGLIGEADGGTLFLDEIGELPPDLQAHLLRVLDEHGEYQRLGEATVRRSDFRLIAATNRPPEQLKLDFLARLVLRIDVPPLRERVEDVPLVAAHLLASMAADDPEVAARFFDPASRSARIEPRLVIAIVGHDHRANVRELEAILWRSLTTSPGDALALTAEVQGMLGSTLAPAARTSPPTAEELREAIRRHGGVKERVWRELGLASRYALRRLLKKHGIADPDRS
jgi:two-component system, NtrC family, response regulator HydG